jgi:very-short-patch-repair endonuclease
MRPLEQTHGWDERIARLAEAQHGVVARGQLIEMGLMPDAVKRRLRAGRLRQLHAGVYAVGHCVLSREARWMAAVLACGPSAVLSYWSAAAHWGFRGHSGGSIHVTSPSKSRSHGAIRRHRALLRPDEVTIHDGIPVTTVPRTNFDLAAISSAQTVESALRQCEYLRLYDPLFLGDLIERYPGHRANPAARAALVRLGETPGETEEGLEERFLVFLDEYRLPRPRFNVWLEVQGHRYKVDCLWPAQRLIAELDSWQAHGTRSAFQTDKSRDRRLLLAGYATTRITAHHLAQEPATLALDLRRLLTGPQRNHT